MGRYFSKERGRAVSFAGLGHVSGEAVLPIAAVAMLSVLDWRGIWRTGALALVACGIPLILWLLRCARIGPPPGLAAGPAAPSPSGSTQERAGVSLKEALRDPGLYMRLPVLMASSFIITGLIFHQVHIGEQKGWGLELLASGLSVNAAGALAMMILAGGLIDRFSAVKIVPYCLAPMTLACISLAMLDNVFGALLFFALLGIGWGLTAVMIGTIWAELYGVTHLGAIRAFAAALNVFASGLAPPILGVLLDWQMTAEAIAAACATYCVSAAGLSMLAPKVPLYLRLQR
jgi:MFS family permease